jgi:hypothetical protein
LSVPTKNEAAISSGLKRLRCEANLSVPSSAEVNE